MSAKVGFGPTESVTVRKYYIYIPKIQKIMTAHYFPKTKANNNMDKITEQLQLKSQPIKSFDYFDLFAIQIHTTTHGDDKT